MNFIFTRRVLVFLTLLVTTLLVTFPLSLKRSYPGGILFFLLPSLLTGGEVYGLPIQKQFGAVSFSNDFRPSFIASNTASNKRDPSASLPQRVQTPKNRGWSTEGKKAKKISSQKLTKSPLTKEKLLEKNYRKPGSSPEALRKTLNTHLESIESFCHDKKATRGSGQNRIEDLYQFLHGSIQSDPYMDGSTKVLFGLLLDTIEESLIGREDLSSERFIMQYLAELALPRTTDLSKDIHKEALQIKKGLVCMEQAK